MKRIILIPVIMLGLALAGYYVWWQYAAQQMERLTLEWVEELRSQGYQAYHGEPEFSGFPLQLEMTLPAPLVTAPDDSFTYKSASLKLDTLPWNPIKYRLKFPPLQEITVDKDGFKDAFDIKTDEAFVLATLAIDGTLKRLDIVISGVDITAQNLGDSLIAENLTLALVLPEAPAATSKDIALTMHITGTRLRLPKAVKSPLKQTIKQLSTRFHILGPINTKAPPMDAIIGWQKGGGKIDIMELSLKWDELQVAAHGELAFDDALYPLATIEAKIAGLGTTMLTLADKGLVDKKIARLSAIGLQLMAKKPADGGPAVVNVPLSAQGGELYLGPLRIADVPNLKGQFINVIPDRADPAPVGSVDIEPTLPDLNEPPTVTHENLAN